MRVIDADGHVPDLIESGKQAILSGSAEPLHGPLGATAA